jgi:hypothetical protein
LDTYTHEDLWEAAQVVVDRIVAQLEAGRLDPMLGDHRGATVHALTPGVTGGLPNLTSVDLADQLSRAGLQALYDFAHDPRWAYTDD